MNHIKYVTKKKKDVEYIVNSLKDQDMKDYFKEIFIDRPWK
jgi:hypothetical protein